MLICQVVSGLMYGGGQRVALDLAVGLDDSRGMRTLLVLLGDRLSPALPRVDSEYVQVSGYDGRYNRPISLVRAAVALRRVLRQCAADIVHSHGWDADVITGLAVRGSAIPHFVHQHILAEWASSTRLVHAARRLLTRGVLSCDATHWIAVSNAVKESLGPLPWLRRDAIAVVRNGIDIERFRPREDVRTPLRPVIGVAARLAPMKGLHYLIDAVADLDKRGIACELRIAGEGPLCSELQRSVSMLQLNDRVIFLGHVADLRCFYESIDIFALPSIALEGLPLSVLEAMACGLPVVSTTVSGIPEAVVSGETGTLVPPRDSGGLSSALEPLLRSAKLRAQMGAKGRKRAESAFSTERFFADIASAYSDVTA